MRGRSLLLTVVAVMMLSALSCTYNYFGGVVNYKVYVPEVENGTVNNCLVLIYDAETGELVAQSYAEGKSGSDGQTELDKGVFGFFLDPGQYKVVVLTNVDNIEVNPGTSLDDAYFAHLIDEATQTYGSPGAIYYDVMDRPFDGNQSADTIAANKLYPARIDVRFHGQSVDPSAVASAVVTIDNVSSVQKFINGNIPEPGPDNVARYEFKSPQKYPADADGAIFEFPVYLFPTSPDAVMHLTLTLYDADGNVLGTFEYGLYDDSPAEDGSHDRRPLDLKSGDHVIVDITDNGITIGIVGWDEEISGSESDIMGQKPQAV